MEKREKEDGIGRGREGEASNVRDRDREEGGERKSEKSSTTGVMLSIYLSIYLSFPSPKIFLGK